MADDGWAGERGVVRLPGGALVRGRRLADDVPPADFALVLAPGPAPAWPHRRVRWPDFWIPLDGDDARDALREAHRRALGGERVEVACRGGVGRTGTALAALAVLDGLSPGRGGALGAPRVPPPRGRDALAAVVAAPGPLTGTPSSGGTRRAAGPLGCPYNCTGGDWSRLRSCDQGKRAEEGNDDLVNHPLQTNKCRS